MLNFHYLKSLPYDNFLSNYSLKILFFGAIIAPVKFRISTYVELISK
jgi:hypothetical protein